MKLPDRAWQTWPILTLAASHRQTLTYEILGRLTNMHAAGLGAVLEHIQSYCLENKLPPLTALVVNKNTGLPSEGFVATKDVPRAFVQIFDFDWQSIACPTPALLAEAAARRPSNGVISAAVDESLTPFPASADPR
jgi:hypothetical protein